MTATAVSPNDPSILAPKTLEEATELVSELVGVVQALSAENESLRAQVEQLSQRVGSSSRNSSRPPSTDSDASRRKRKPRKSSGRSRGAQPGHTKHERALHDEDKLSAPPQSFRTPLTKNIKSYAMNEYIGKEPGDVHFVEIEQKMVNTLFCNLLTISIFFGALDQLISTISDSAY